MKKLIEKADKYEGTSILRKQLAESQKVIDQQSERIERLRRAKFKVPRSPSLGRMAASYCRFIIPDTHGAHVDGEALSAMLGDMRALSPSIREVVLLGDHLDCGGFLAQHHTLGYVAETQIAFEDDEVAANGMLDSVQAAAPLAEFHFLEGNHERRIERFCVTAALGNSRNAAYLAKKFNVEDCLSLKKRNISFYKQGQWYGDCRIPATIKLGRCHFTHGNRTGRNPATAMLRDFGGNVVFGHTHRMDSDSSRTVKDGEIGAWSPGCLCKLQPLWQHTQVTGWAHGYAIQLVRSDGDFLHINVPIIRGKSYLMQLAGKMKL